VGDRWLCRHLVREHRAGRLRGPVILIGHSCGGRYALFASRRLEPPGVAVELLVCVDVAWPFDVSGNMRRAIHLYRTRRRLYLARPLRLAPGSAAVENLDLDTPGSPIAARGLHHLNITAAPAVQSYLIGQVLLAVAAWSPGHCQSLCRGAPAEPFASPDRPRE
jgi:thioesterase domain-containing protein